MSAQSWVRRPDLRQERGTEEGARREEGLRGRGGIRVGGGSIGGCGRAVEEVEEPQGAMFVLEEGVVTPAVPLGANGSTRWLLRNRRSLSFEGRPPPSLAESKAGPQGPFRLGLGFRA